MGIKASLARQAEFLIPEDTGSPYVKYDPFLSRLNALTGWESRILHRNIKIRTLLALYLRQTRTRSAVK